MAAKIVVSAPMDANRIRHAIILAAGMGIRLRPLSRTIPKALIPVHGATLLERTLDALTQSGVEHMTIVTGHLGTMLRTFVGPTYNGVPIEYRENREYASSNSMHSLFVARDTIDEDILALHSDLLFESRVIPAVIQAPQKDVLVTADPICNNDVVYVHMNDAHAISRITKDTSMASAMAYIGIAKLSYPLLKKVFRSIEAHADHMDEYLETYLMKHQRDFGPVFACHCSNLIWGEVDTTLDLQFLLANVAPKLQVSAYTSASS